jgi:hypothetical protein
VPGSVCISVCGWSVLSYWLNPEGVYFRAGPGLVGEGPCVESFSLQGAQSRADCVSVHTTERADDRKRELFYSGFYSAYPFVSS